MARQPHRPAVDAPGRVQVCDVGAHSLAADLARLRVDAGQRDRAAPYDFALVRKQRHRHPGQRDGHHHRREAATRGPPRASIVCFSSGYSFS